MLYHGGDRYIQEFFIENSYPGPDVIQQVYEFLASLDDDPIQLTQQDVKEQLGLSIGNDGVGNCEQILESAGVLERLVSSQNMATVRIDSDLPTCVDLLPRQAKVRRRVLQAVEKIVGDRRNELVQFRPQALTAALEMDQPAVAHALYELGESDWFTYVPPFRGRAIRMLKRDVPFEDLEIDFAALEKRKAAEYDKLNRMVRFALSGGVPAAGDTALFRRRRGRPVQSLRQLQQAAGAGSGRSREQGSQTPSSGCQLVLEEAVEEGVIEAVRMVLSGVARAESRFACGKNLIAQMLCGSNSAKVKKLRLNQLSTFGLLWQLKQAEVVTLIDILIAIGCLEQEDVDRFRPVLKLTPLGGDVMRGKAELPAGLKLPGELRLKLRRPTAKDTPRPKVGGQGPEAGSQRPDGGDQKSAPATSPAKIAQPSGQAADEADMKVRPRTILGLSGRSDEGDRASPSRKARLGTGAAGRPESDVVEGSLGDSGEATPGKFHTAAPKPAVIRRSGFDHRINAGAGQPAVVLLDLAALVPRLSGGRVPGDPRNHARNAVGSRLAGGGKRLGSPFGLVPVGRNDRRAGRRDWGQSAEADSPAAGATSARHPL